MKSARTLLITAMMGLVSGCYSDMTYGIEEPDADEASAQWWCSYYNSCEKSGGSIWGSSKSDSDGGSIWGSGGSSSDSSSSSSSSE